MKGVPDLKVELGQVAHAVAGTPGYALPGGILPGMESTKNFMVDDLTFVNGTVAVEVEVDVETGKVTFRNVRQTGVFKERETASNSGSSCFSAVRHVR